MARIVHSRSGADGVDRKAQAVTARQVLAAKTRAEELAKLESDAAVRSAARRGKTTRLRSGSVR